MKKIFMTLLASTMLVGVAGQANATAYGSAKSIRDTLTDVYSGLGGTFSTDDAGAEYAELLYRIDNLGTVTGVTLSLVDGTLTASGGTSTGLFTVNQVIAQVDTFVADLNTDMFGSGNDVDDLDASSNSHSGLAGTQLNKIVNAVTKVNAILNDVDSTGAERNAAIAWFYDGTGSAPSGFTGSWTGFGNTNGSTGEAEKFNDATTALANISDDVTAIKGVTDGDYGDYALDGSVVTSATVDGANIDHETIDNRMYASYTDYVSGTTTLQVGWFTLFHNGYNSGNPVENEHTGTNSSQAVQINAGTIGLLGNTNAGSGRRVVLQANGKYWAHNGSSHSEFTNFMDAVNHAES